MNRSKDHFRHCIACDNRFGTMYLSFFRFPKNEDMCKLWIYNLKIRDPPSYEDLIKKYRVCSVHFEDKMFPIAIGNFKGKRLKKDAYPTLNPLDYDGPMLQFIKTEDKGKIPLSEAITLIETTSSTSRNARCNASIKSFKKIRKNPKEYCRLCGIKVKREYIGSEDDLDEHAPLISIFGKVSLNRNIPTIINNYLPITVIKNDERLPKQICQKCMRYLVDWNDQMIRYIQFEKKMYSMFGVPRPPQNTKSASAENVNSSYDGVNIRDKNEENEAVLNKTEHHNDGDNNGTESFNCDEIPDNTHNYTDYVDKVTKYGDHSYFGYSLETGQSEMIELNSDKDKSFSTKNGDCSTVIIHSSSYISQEEDGGNIIPSSSVITTNTPNLKGSGEVKCVPLGKSTPLKITSVGSLKNISCVKNLPPNFKEFFVKIQNKTRVGKKTEIDLKDSKVLLLVHPVDNKSVTLKSENINNDGNDDDDEEKSKENTSPLKSLVNNLSDESCIFLKLKQNIDETKNFDGMDTEPDQMELNSGQNDNDNKNSDDTFSNNTVATVVREPEKVNSVALHENLFQQTALEIVSVSSVEKCGIESANKNPESLKTICARAITGKKDVKFKNLIPLENSSLKKNIGNYFFEKYVLAQKCKVEVTVIKHNKNSIDNSDGTDSQQLDKILKLEDLHTINIAVYRQSIKFKESSQVVSCLGYNRSDVDKENDLENIDDLEDNEYLSATKYNFKQQSCLCDTQKLFIKIIIDTWTPKQADRVSFEPAFIVLKINTCLSRSFKFFLTKKLEKLLNMQGLTRSESEHFKSYLSTEVNKVLGSLTNEKKVIIKTKTSKKNTESISNHVLENNEKKNENFTEVMMTDDNQLIEIEDPNLSKKLKNAPVFKCNLCNKTISHTFLTQKALDKHVYWYHNEGSCSFCNKKYKSHAKLKAHQKMHENEFNNELEQESNIIVHCCVCNKKFNNPNKLRLHERIHDPSYVPIPKNREQKCNICGIGFTTLLRLDKHRMHVHNIVNHVSCEICGKEFFSKMTLKSHVKCVHEDSDCLCSFCGKLLTSEGALRVHIKGVHNKLLNYPCSICGKSFSTSTYVKRHMAKHTYSRKTADSKTLCCLQCFKPFSSNEEIKAHMEEVHTESSSLICTICNHSFKRVGALLSHLIFLHWTEVNEVPEKHPCLICNEMFSEGEDLVDHIMAHADDEKVKALAGPKSEKKKLQCPDCDVFLFNRKDIAIHRIIEHQNWPFICSLDDCNEVKFWSKVSLDVHKYERHAAFTHQCYICSETFDFLKEKVLHVKEMHPYESFSGEERIKINKKSRRLYQLGRLKHRSSGPVKVIHCDICNKVFKNSYHLRRHKSTHDPNKNKYKCPKCNRCYSLMGMFSKHLLRHEEQEKALDLISGGIINDENLNENEGAVENIQYQDDNIQYQDENVQYQDEDVQFHDDNIQYHDESEAIVISTDVECRDGVIVEDVQYHEENETIIEGVQDNIQSGDMDENSVRIQCQDENRIAVESDVNGRVEIVMENVEEMEVDGECTWYQEIGVEGQDPNYSSSVITMYKCPECDVMFKHEVDLNLHFKVKHQECYTLFLKHHEI